MHLTLEEEDNILARFNWRSTGVVVTLPRLSSNVKNRIENKVRLEVNKRGLSFSLAGWCQVGLRNN